MRLASNVALTRKPQIFIGVVCFSTLISGCSNSHNPDPPVVEKATPQPLSADSKNAPKSVSFKTVDGWTIKGTLYSASKSGGAAILLHQRGGSKSDWTALCESLKTEGVTALAIDQRGAGESTAGPGGKGDNAPWDTSEDIAAAVGYLNNYKTIGLAGASYGANNALIYAAEHPARIKAVALFSPGADYNGLKTAEPAKLWKGPLRVYHDRGDSVAAEGPELIDKASASSDHRLFLSSGDRHGTALLREAMKEGEGVDKFFGSVLK